MMDWRPALRLALRHGQRQFVDALQAAVDHELDAAMAAFRHELAKVKAEYEAELATLCRELAAVREELHRSRQLAAELARERDLTQSSH